MSDYIERVRVPTYTSPSGATFTLQFDDLDRSGGKKAAVHEFPQQDTAEVQDLGNSAEKYPMTAYFTGPDFDLQADALWKALSEKHTLTSPGVLKHPRWGDINVMPLSWSQAEKWVDGLGRADFRIDFIQVRVGSVFPLTAVASADAISASVTGAIGGSVEDAAAVFEPVNALDEAVTKKQVKTFLENYSAAFDKVTAVSESVQAEASKIVNEITTTIDTLISEPVELFTSLARLAALPATIVTGIVGKVDAYRELITATARSVPETYAQAVVSVQSLFYAFAGASQASSNGGAEGADSGLSTRSQAIASANAIDEIAQTVSLAVEAAEDAVPEFRADPETLSALVDAAATARASLLDRAFSLRAERRVTLVTERTPLDLVSEFYDGSIDNLDEFIETNGLEGNEIILIPAGREVVYYG